MLSYEQARKIVIENLSHPPKARSGVLLKLESALGRVLAEDVIADRDYPPFHRSTRDGYAVRASDAIINSRLRCAGELKAGDAFAEPLLPGTCVQIMTGASVPPGADAVVMVERTNRDGDEIVIERAANAGQNIVPRGSEAVALQTVLPRGTRLGYAELALAAQVGAVQLNCARKPRVAILSTGDEVIAIDQTPSAVQIRNANSVSLAAQVRIAGGEPVNLGHAADDAEELRAAIMRGLRDDVLLISGGVSMGKYDLVESVLKGLGAQFYFDAVAIRPGKPTVFGTCQGKPVFGLPGNPVSTMVTFELFVIPAIDILSGSAARPVPLVEAKLGKSLTSKPGLTHFLPAKIAWQRGAAEVSAVAWQGSGDIVAMAAANCFLVVGDDTDRMEAGTNVPVLLRKDVL